jgi:ATP-dependent Clp protease ATP-binding subunit ClpX
MILPRTMLRPVPPQARASYRALYSISRRASLPSSRSSSTYNRSDFSGQGFSSFYEPDQPFRGPLSSSSNVGAGHITPKALRAQLDRFVVDQDRAKIVLSVAVHEHHLRIQELKRQQEERQGAEKRASMYRHPVEGSPSLISTHMPMTPSKGPS